MEQLRRFVRSGVACMCLSALFATSGSAQKSDKDSKDSADKRPSVRLKATPVISVAPARVVLSAEIVGGPNDFEEFYCPSIEWEWGDGTTSESSSDCAPYEAGKSEIKRRFTVEHVFRRPDNYRVSFRLKRRDKAVGFASVQVQVRPGLPDGQ